MTSELELITALGTRFVQRRDVKARQYVGGAWKPVERRGPGGTLEERYPFVLADFERHVRGEAAYGHYLTDESDHTKLFAFDIDLRAKDIKGNRPTWFRNDQDEMAVIDPRGTWLDTGVEGNLGDYGRQFLRIQLRCLAEGLARKIQAQVGCHVAVAYSGGKGLHVYGFVGALTPEGYVNSADARAVGLKVLTDAGFEPSRGNNFFMREGCLIEVEVFPKQESLEGKDLGNLMGLPLGKNFKTGHPKFFLDCTTAYDTFEVMDPYQALTNRLPWEPAAHKPLDSPSGTNDDASASMSPIPAGDHGEGSVLGGTDHVGNGRSELGSRLPSDRPDPLFGKPAAADIKGKVEPPPPPAPKKRKRRKRDPEPWELGNDFTLIVE